MNRQLFLSKSLVVAAIAILVLDSVGLVWLAENLHRPSVEKEIGVSHYEERTQAVGASNSAQNDSIIPRHFLLKPAVAENLDSDHNTRLGIEKQSIVRRLPPQSPNSILPASSETGFPACSQVIDLPPVDDTAEIERSNSRTRLVLLEDLPAVSKP